MRGRVRVRVRGGAKVRARARARERAVTVMAARRPGAAGVSEPAHLVVQPG